MRPTTGEDALPARAHQKGAYGRALETLDMAPCALPSQGEGVRPMIGEDALPARAHQKGAYGRAPDRPHMDHMKPMPDRPPQDVGRDGSAPDHSPPCAVRAAFVR